MSQFLNRFCTWLSTPANSDQLRLSLRPTTPGWPSFSNLTKWLEVISISVLNSYIVKFNYKGALLFELIRGWKSKILLFFAMDVICFAYLNALSCVMIVGTWMLSYIKMSWKYAWSLSTLTIHKRIRYCAPVYSFRFKISRRFWTVFCSFFTESPCIFILF
jgi:hypothetical protein